MMPTAVSAYLRSAGWSKRPRLDIADGVPPSARSRWTPPVGFRDLKRKFPEEKGMALGGRPKGYCTACDFDGMGWCGRSPLRYRQAGAFPAPPGWSPGVWLPARFDLYKPWTFGSVWNPPPTGFSGDKNYIHRAVNSFFDNFRWISGYAHPEAGPCGGHYPKIRSCRPRNSHRSRKNTASVRRKPAVACPGGGNFGRKCGPAGVTTLVKKPRMEEGMVTECQGWQGPASSEGLNQTNSLGVTAKDSDSDGSSRAPEGEKDFELESCVVDEGPSGAETPVTTGHSAACESEDDQSSDLEEWDLLGDIDEVSLQWEDKHERNKSSCCGHRRSRTLKHRSAPNREPNNICSDSGCSEPEKCDSCEWDLLVDALPVQEEDTFKQPDNDKDSVLFVGQASDSDRHCQSYPTPLSFVSEIPAASDNDDSDFDETDYRSYDNDDDDKLLDFCTQFRDPFCDFKVPPQFDSGLDDLTKKMSEVNMKWCSNFASCTSLKKVKPQVHFAEEDKLITIHYMVTWLHAYQTARKGPWEEYARDRERFKLRINAAEKVLSPVLDQIHRQHVYNSYHSL